MDLAFALNKQRYYIGNTDPKYKETIRKKVPKVAYYKFNKNFEKMTKDEGFHKVYEYMPDVKLKYCFV